MSGAALAPPVVDPLVCSKSLWTGQHNTCRWCNNPLNGRDFWCCEDCYWAFVNNHEYPRARRHTKQKSKGRCSCPGKQKHPRCSECGVCEPQSIKDGDGPLECNHRVPRLGNRSHWSCLHHLTNLEMLCHPCHLKETERQMVQYGRAPSLIGKTPLTKLQSKQDRRVRLARWRKAGYHRTA